MKTLIIKAVRKTTTMLETISPRLAHWWAGWLFFSPRMTQREAPEITNLKQEWLSFKTIDGGQGRCRVYSAGSGPAVLLMHGWEGAARSLTSIANELLKNGMRVILFDMPAHGLSKGRKTNLIEVSRIAQKIAAREGALHGVIAHSLGAVAAGHAIKSGMKVDRLISISAPTSMLFIVDHFCSMVNASERTKMGLIKQIEAILQEPYEHASLTETAKHFSIDGLIVHDHNDRMVPCSQAENLAATWHKARLFRTKKLGHNRILQNNEVIQAVTWELLAEENDENIPMDLAANQ